MAMANDLANEDVNKEVILKQGYVRIKSHRVFPKWKKKWAILQDSEILSKRYIKLFKNDKVKKKTESSQTIFPDCIKHIELIELCNSPSGLNITLKDGKNQVFMFDSESETKDWHDSLQKLCFKDMKHKETEDQEIEKQQEPENEESEDLIDGEIKEPRDIFEVCLQPSAKLRVSGQCILQITPQNIELHDMKDQEMFLALWPIDAMRRFGFDQNKFMFEAGRHCDTGEGIFIFKSQDGEQIHKIVQRYAEQLAVQRRTLSSADENDNDDFELRPLPPIPPD